MFETILALLKASGADAWEASDTVTEGWEFYFIRHRLDQNRVRDVEHIRVRVCRKSPDGKTLGSASGEIAPTASATGTEFRGKGPNLLQFAYPLGLTRGRKYQVVPSRSADGSLWYTGSGKPATVVAAS